MNASRVSLLLTVVAGLVLTSCGIPMRGGGYFDQDVDFSRYRTFAWDEPDDRPTGDPRLENNEFFVEQLHLALEEELAARGIRYDETAPDLLVHHHASVRDRVEVHEIDRVAGYETSEYGPGTRVFQYEEGTLLVDIADAETRTIIWRGWAQGDVARALDDNEAMRERMAEAVRKMFEELPISGRTLLSNAPGSHGGA